MAPMPHYLKAVSLQAAPAVGMGGRAHIARMAWGEEPDILSVTSSTTPLVTCDQLSPSHMPLLLQWASEVSKGCH